MLALATLAVLACASPQPAGPKLVPGTPPLPKPSDEAPAAQKPSDAPCADECVMLLEHAYEDLADGGYCAVCGGGEACEERWPPEPLTCERVDYLRNCIYARLGYPFDTAPEWREVFDKEAWYEARADFDWGDVTKVQVRNAKKLKKMHDTRDCVR